MGLLERHLAGVEAGVDQLDEPVPLEEALVEGPGPVGVREHADAQAPARRAARAGAASGSWRMWGVHASRWRTAASSSSASATSRPELGGGLGQQVGQGGAALVARRGGPEVGLDRDEPGGDLVLVGGVDVAGGQPPGVDQLGVDELRERPAPVEDDGGDHHVAGLSNSTRATATNRSPGLLPLVGMAEVTDLFVVEGEGARLGVRQSAPLMSQALARGRLHLEGGAIGRHLDLPGRSPSRRRALAMTRRPAISIFVRIP